MDSPHAHLGADPAAPPPPPAADASVLEHDRYWLAHVYLPESAQALTLRALLAGCAIGGVMSFSNLYIGLKTGWGLGASITSAIIAYALFSSLERALGSGRMRRFTFLENNTVQTAASAAAYMTSAGLVAAIPALYMVSKEAIAKDPKAVPPLYLVNETGHVVFDVPTAIPWLIAICLVGVVAAIPVKRKLINDERLRFPSGVACAATLRSLHAEGGDGARQARGLFIGAAIAALIKAIKDIGPMLGGVKAPGAMTKGLAAAWPTLGDQVAIFGPGLAKWKVALGTDLWTLGAGAIMGMRVTLSMMLFAFFAHIVAPPLLLDAGYITCAKLPAGAVCSPEHLQYGDFTSWTLWPGVALMVAHSLVGLALQLPKMLGGLTRTLGGKAAGAEEGVQAVPGLAAVEVPRAWFWGGLLVAGGAAIAMQKSLFGIEPIYGALSVALALGLAFVAARSVAETDINPIGAMGKVTQLVFGGVLPGAIVPNLMTASVTGGAASQTGDLLTDLKTGHLLGANPRVQVLAQIAGVFIGAVFAAIAYSVLVDPAELGTPEWPAPAAVVWAKVAELLSKGLDHMASDKLTAIGWASLAGSVVAVVEFVAPPSVRKWLPSIGGGAVAVLVPFVYSFNMFLGALVAAGLQRVRPAFAAAFLVVGASGLIAGETLMGVALKFVQVFALK